MPSAQQKWVPIAVVAVIAAGGAAGWWVLGPTPEGQPETITIGVVIFDMAAPFNEMQHSQIRKVMSDHRPIWAKFRIDQPDDDGQ